MKRSRLPVTGAAQFLQLVDDGAALVLAPFPDPLDKGVAAEIVTALAFFGKLPLDHVLGGDARMVGAGQPERVVAAHAMIAGQDILQGVVQGMADMQNTGDIGRRNNDGEPGFAILHRGLEAVLFCPGFQPLFFDIAEIVALGQFFRIRFIHHAVLIVFRLS